MTDIKIENCSSLELSTRTSNLVGFYSAILTAVLTFLAFGFAMVAVPISGANCLEGCIKYPYLKTISQYPKDYLWMYLAIVMLLSYLVLMAAVHSYASQQRKIFAQIGLIFSVIAALILLADYFVQFSVVPVSLMSGETDGITLLTQYNPHGVFIALEEVGYLMMSISFLFTALVFVNKNRLDAAIRWIFFMSSVLVIISLILISIYYGLNRQDRFEVIVISISWLVLIINGVLLSIMFGRELKMNQDLMEAM